jgi:membrane protease YdiL (CAAX protease family)
LTGRLIFLSDQIQLEEQIPETVKQEINELLEFRFNPTRELALIATSWLAVVGGLYTAFKIVTTSNVALNFILYGPVSLLMLGTVVPVSYITWFKKESLDELGITREHWLPSILIGIGLGVNTYLKTLASVQYPELRNLVPLIVMALTVGLFESIFFRGWVQLGLERAFGAIPAIILGAGMYALYHIGYGMNMPEIWFLFTLGLQFAVAFRVTKNILVLWPFYTWVGGLYTNISEGLLLPFEATYGFVIVLILMMISLIGFGRYQRTIKKQLGM